MTEKTGRVATMHLTPQQFRRTVDLSWQGQSLKALNRPRAAGRAARGWNVAKNQRRHLPAAGAAGMFELGPFALAGRRHFLMAAGRRSRRSGKRQCPEASSIRGGTYS
jgi:hypothetical protein